MNEYIFSALVFGLTAGLKPGPLGIVVIQQTLTYGLKYGIKASLAPIITDGPIIFATLVMLSQFKNITLFIGTISFFGGIYLIWLSIKMLIIKEMTILKSLSTPTSLTTAIKVNLLSPYPYLFWFTVGGAYLSKGNQAQSIVFVTVAIGTLVVSKMFIAWVASTFKYFLDSQAYLWVMRILGILLSIFAFLLLHQSYYLLTT